MVAFVNRPEDSIGPAPAHDAASWPQCCSECGQAALREVGTCPVIGGRQEKLLEISQRPHLLPCRSRPAIRHQSHLHLRRRHHHHTGIFDPGGRCSDAITHVRNTSPGVRMPCAAASRASGFRARQRRPPCPVRRHPREDDLCSDMDIAPTQGGAHYTAKKKQNKAWESTWLRKWLLKNAARSGFQPIPTEAWHWEYKS